MSSLGGHLEALGAKVKVLNPEFVADTLDRLHFPSGKNPLRWPGADCADVANRWLAYLTKTLEASDG